MNSTNNKRPHPDSSRSLHITPNTPLTTSPSKPSSAGSGGHSSASSAFRNVSACNRCRLRKNRCDQNLPACASCEKANVKCVGYDPITKREIPRAYVYYLESRVSYLEDALRSRGISFPPADDFGVGTTKAKEESTSPVSPLTAKPLPQAQNNGHLEEKKQKDEADKLNKLVSNIGMVSVQGASDPRYLGSTSGISFARVVFAAVRNSVSGSTSERTGIRPGKPLAAGGGAPNFRDSFFGLQSKPSFKPAPLPDKELAARLINLYFEHANPQIPILHRGEFMALFDRTYATEERRRGYREQYMLFIVFAIGAGTILGAPDDEDENQDDGINIEPSSPKHKRLKMSSQQFQPEEYHASAMVHLGYFLSSSPASDRPEGFGGSLEELQAVLLLAGFALLRPVAPGLWYICGVAMRLAVDLGLHYEDGTGVEDSMGGTGVARQEVALEAAGVRPSAVDAREKGRREWVRDLRRRLWWCVYSFDRLVSVCVGRPFGITDQVITTEFPSILDDNYITTSGFTAPPGAENEPSSKRVAYHYFRLRLIQSEILQVLQYRQARQARDRGRNQGNEFMHTKLRSPFLDRYESFQSWRRDIDRRLWEWKGSAPNQKETTVSFSVQFLELNYWQAVIMLYRQSLTVPPELDGEMSPSSEISSPMEKHIEDEENDEDIFLKVAEAGQKVLKIYYQLNKSQVVNYTFLATHHLFMAGIAFLYAIWHSVTVRGQLTLEDVDYTILAGTTVLRNLSDKCPPAEACRDAFDRMAKATIKMCQTTTGFGTRAPMLGFSKSATSPPQHHTPPYNPQQSQQISSPPDLQSPYQRQAPPNFYHAPDSMGRFRPQRPPPQFDMNLRDLFPEDTPENQSFRQNIGRMQAPPQPAAALPNAMHYGARSTPSPVHSFSPPSVPSAGGDALSMASTSPSTYAGNQGQTPTYSSVYGAGSQPTSVPLDQNNPIPNNPYANSLSNDLDALLGDSTGAFNGNAGLSLGFDTDHDWNDGWGPDLFEGFWFGGYNGGGGMGGFGGMMDESGEGMG